MATGTKPIDEVATTPFCGACGFDVVLSGDVPSGIGPQDAAPDPWCSACGADLRAFNFTPLTPIPTP